MLHSIVTKNCDDIALQIQKLISQEDQQASFVIDQESTKLINLDRIESQIVFWIDMRGSGLDRLRVLRDTKKLYPFCKFIWLDDDDKQALDAYAEGVDGFLLLPLDNSKVAITLGNLNIKMHSVR